MRNRICYGMSAQVCSSEDPRYAYVIAMNTCTRQIAIRPFENKGNGDEDFESELDAVCYEVGWDCVWAAHYGPLTPDKISEIVSHLMAYASGRDEGC